MTMPLTETLAMIITAEGAQASAVLDDLGAKLTKLNAQSADTGKAIGTAVTVGAVVAGSALVELVKNGVEALEQQQVVAAQTVAALESTGDAAHVTATQIHSLAEEISAYSGFSIEAVQTTENLLLTFTNIKNTDTAKIFDETTVAVADMARALGEDATTAATQLGKALNAPDTGLTALQRAGVQFTASQKEVIKSLFDTGQQAEAQQIILDKVSQKFGGSAKAYGDTTAGALDKVKNSITEVEKTLAAPLLSPIADTLNTVATVLNTVNRDAPGLIYATGAVVALGAAWVLAEKGIAIYQGLQAGVLATATKNALGIGAEGDAIVTTGTEAEVAAGQMGLFAASEDAAGASGAAAVGGISAAGSAAAAAGASLTAFLGLAAAAGAVVGGAAYVDSKQSQHVSAIPDKGFLGKLLNAGNVFPDFLQSVLDGGGSKKGPSYGELGPQNNPAWDNYVNSLKQGNVHDAVNSLGYNPLQSGRDFSTNAAGIYGQDILDNGAGALDYTGPGGQFYVPPAAAKKRAAGAGSGSGALATAAAQATLAGLFGLTPDGIAAALDQGIITGTDPLSQLMSDAGNLLTGTAKTIVGNLASILNSAIQAGQAAEKSLQFNASSAPQFGTQTNITIDPKTGKLTSQVQSPVLAQLQTQLASDKTFAGDIGKLSKLNLAPDLLQQYISAGPGGTVGLDALANSSPSDIAAINKADASVNILARSFGEQVSQTQYLAQAVGLLQQLLIELPGSQTKTALTVGNQKAAAAQLAAHTVPKKGVFSRAS
jgi:hypothetical protein